MFKFNLATYIQQNYDDNKEAEGLFTRFFDSLKDRFVLIPKDESKIELARIKQCFFADIANYITIVNDNKHYLTRQILLIKIVAAYDSYKTIVETAICDNLDYQSIDNTTRKKITKKLSPEEENAEDAKKKLSSLLADSFLLHALFPEESLQKTHETACVIYGYVMQEIKSIIQKKITLDKAHENLKYWINNQPSPVAKKEISKLSLWDSLAIDAIENNTTRKLNKALIDVLYACEQLGKDVLHEILYQLYQNHKIEFNKVMQDILEDPLTFEGRDEKEKLAKIFLWGNISFIWKKISRIFDAKQDYNHFLSQGLAKKWGITQEVIDDSKISKLANFPLLFQYMSAAPFFVGSNETQVFKDLHYLCEVHPDLTQTEFLLDNSRLSGFKTFDDYLNSLPADQNEKIKQYYAEHQRSREFFEFIFEINSLVLNKDQFDTAVDIAFAVLEQRIIEADEKKLNELNALLKSIGEDEIELFKDLKQLLQVDKEAKKDKTEEGERLLEQLKETLQKVGKDKIDEGQELYEKLEILLKDDKKRITSAGQKLLDEVHRLLKSARIIREGVEINRGFFSNARNQLAADLNKFNRPEKIISLSNIENSSDEEDVDDTVVLTAREMLSPQTFLEFLQDESQIVTNSQIIEAVFKLDQEDFNVDFSNFKIEIIFYRLSLFKSANLVNYRDKTGRSIGQVFDQVFTAISDRFVSEGIVFDDTKFSKIAEVQMKNHLGNEKAYIPDRLWVEMLKGLDKKERELAESKKATKDYYFIDENRVKRNVFYSQLNKSEERHNFECYTVDSKVELQKINKPKDLGEHWQECHFNYGCVQNKYLTFDRDPNPNNDIIKHQQQLLHAIDTIKKHIAELDKAIINKQIAVFKIEALESLTKKLTYAMSNPDAKVENVVSQWKKQKTDVHKIETKTKTIITNAMILGIHRKPTLSLKEKPTDSEIVIDSLAYPKMIE